MVIESLQSSVKALFILVLACVLTLVSRNTFAVGTSDTAPSTAGITADDQAMNASDMEITRKIRQQIVSNKTMSLNARNIKIVSKDGKVVLKGKVASPAEKTQVGDIAETVVGTANVMNDTTILKR